MKACRFSIDRFWWRHAKHTIITIPHLFVYPNISRNVFFFFSPIVLFFSHQSTFNSNVPLGKWILSFFSDIFCVDWCWLNDEQDCSETLNVCLCCSCSCLCAHLLWHRYVFQWNGTHSFPFPVLSCWNSTCWMVFCHIDFTRSPYINAEFLSKAPSSVWRLNEARCRYRILFYEVNLIEIKNLCFKSDLAKIAAYNVLYKDTFTTNRKHNWKTDIYLWIRHDALERCGASRGSNRSFIFFSVKKYLWKGEIVVRLGNEQQVKGFWAWWWGPVPLSPPSSALGWPNCHSLENKSLSPLWLIFHPNNTENTIVR